MNCSAWNEKLHDRVDGTLAPADAIALEAHLATCAACRARLESLRALRAATENLPRELPPARDPWPAIERKISGRDTERAASNIFRFPTLAWKLAAAFALVAGVAALWKWRNRESNSPAWSVAALAGAPRVDSKSFHGESRLHVGQWLETDTGSRAKVSVGDIGEVNLEPNSRLRLVDVAANDHRVELARGQMSALIWAPPRLFFVNTPSATAIDLGCAYTLDVADNGNGTLHVTMGYVALEHDGRESIIARGQMCSTRRGAGPGTPFVTDAPAALRRALDRLDFDHARDALPEVLASARPEDAVTLWHLFERVALADRGAVFDALARDHAPPAGVTREGVIVGDGPMLARWASELGVMTFYATKN